MSEHQMETRRRSRSKTPFLRSSCDHENCEHAGEEGHVHHKKKSATAPSVQTIVEETVEVTSSSSSPTAKTKVAATSDYSSADTSLDEKSKKNINNSLQKESSFRSTTSTIITKTKQIGSIFSGAATSTPKANNTLHTEHASNSGSSSTTKNKSKRQLNESAQNTMNAELEHSQQESKNKNSSYSFSRFFGFDTTKSATEANANDGASVEDNNHLAYQEYKRAGEYWNKTPKTDYTYSEFSEHRRILAPGVIAMPNMSRRGLDNHHDRISYMIQREPAKEEFIRRRYESSRFAQKQRASERLLHDSGDEVDQIHLDKNYGHFAKTQSWYMRIITTIVTIATNSWATVTGGRRTALTENESALYRTNLAQQESGVLNRIKHFTSAAYFGFFRYAYLLISSILCLDTWLLRSLTNDTKYKKRFLLLLLLLLPLLIVGGLYYYLHPYETFPPKHFAEITFTMPALPKLDLPKIDVAEYINQENYEALKTSTLEHLNDFYSWSEDYIAYLKTVSQNIYEEGHKLFQRREYYERA